MVSVINERKRKRTSENGENGLIAVPFSIVPARACWFSVVTHLNECYESAGRCSAHSRAASVQT